MAVAMLVMVVPTVFADTTITASDFGNLDFDMAIQYDDDALAIFNFSGYGSFNLLGKSVDNTQFPYMGVDTTTTSVKSSIISDGGFIQFGVQRQDSYGGYGDPDQSSSSYVITSDSASLNFRSWTNYAALKDCNFGFQANDHFLASGDYNAYHNVINGNNNATFLATGSGTLDIDHMSDTAGNTGITFGLGCGCYTNADVTQTGSGFFGVSAHFENSFTNDGITAGGIVDYLEGYSFTDGFSWTNYDFSGN